MLVFQFGAKLMQNIFFFGMSNSLINPMIYGAFHLWKPSTVNKKSAGNNAAYSYVNSRGGGGAGNCNALGGNTASTRCYQAEQSSFNNASLMSQQHSKRTGSGHSRQASGMSRHSFREESKLQRFKRQLTLGILRRGGGSENSNGKKANSRSTTPTSGYGDSVGVAANSAAAATQQSTNKPRPPPVGRSHTTHNGALESDVFLELNGATSNANAKQNCANSPMPPHYHRHSHNGASIMTRCATLECTSQLDRKKVSLRRRQLKAAQAHNAPPGCARSRQVVVEAPTFDYNQEILGSLDIGDGDGAVVDANKA